MKTLLAKLYGLTLVSFFAGIFLCRGEETPQWGDLINHANKIGAVLLEYKKTGSDEIHHPYPLVERTKRINLDKNQIDLVKKLFNTSTNYAVDMSDCVPAYGARLVFYFPNNSDSTNSILKNLEIDFCFSCNHLVGELNNKPLLGKFDSFGPMREPLFYLFKEIFPKDSPLAVVR